MSKKKVIIGGGMARLSAGIYSQQKGFETEIIEMNNQYDFPKLNNFYMYGQWLFPGGGLPTSAQSGKWTLQLICKEMNRKYLHITDLYEKKIMKNIA